MGGGVDSAALTGVDVSDFDGENSRCYGSPPVTPAGPRSESESAAPLLSRPRTLTQKVIGTLRCRARSRWVLSRTDDATVQRRDNMVALTLAGGQLKLIGEKGGGSGHLVWRRDNTVDYITSDRIFGVELGPLR